jgi:hypothetical protein
MTRLLDRPADTRRRPWPPANVPPLDHDCRLSTWRGRRIGTTPQSRVGPTAGTIALAWGKTLNRLTGAKREPALLTVQATLAEAIAHDELAAAAREREGRASPGRCFADRLIYRRRMPRRK